MKAIILPVAETAIEEQLGTPSVKFVLSDTRTTVLQYAVKSGRAMYVGIVDGQVVWLHDRYPWLDRLAERAIEDQKNQR